MNEQIIKDFKKLLKRQAQENRNLMNELDSNCYRVYNQQFSEDINCTVDIYDKYVRITNYNDELSEENKEIIIDSCFSSLYKPKENIIWVDKKKRNDREQHEKRGEEALIIEVTEFGNTFEVDLTTRVDTGLFLDQVLSRKMMAENSAERRVLNLFSYTGAFTVAMAKSGARQVVSVDLSKTYSNWCRRNLERNSISTVTNPVIEGDVMEYISNARKGNEKFDIIICDVPSFSNSRKTTTVFNVQRHYAKLLMDLRDLLNDSGFIYFSTNLKDFTLDNTKLNGFEIKNLKRDILAPGFTKKNAPFKAFILKKGELQDMDSHARYHKNRKRKSGDFKERKQSYREDGRRKDDNENSYSSFMRRNGSNDSNRGGYNRRDSDRRPRRDFDRRDNNRRFDRKDGDRRFNRDSDRRFERRDDDRRPRREFDRRDNGRRFDRKDGDRRFNRDSDRRFDRKDDNRRPRRDFDRRDENRRFERRDDNRRPRREFDRNDSRRSVNRRFDRRDDDRRPRRDFDRGDRRSSSRDNTFDYAERKPKRGKTKLVPYGYGSEKVEK